MTNNSLEPKFPRCPECGGEVQLKARAGRTREYLKGVRLPIPAGFGIPTCTKCGEESMSLDVSEKLDAQLSQVLTERLQKYVETIRRNHSVTQAEIEDALRVTRSYLSHVLSGRKPPSGTLVGMLSLFAEVPGAFEHAIGRPVLAASNRVAGSHPAVYVLRETVTRRCYAVKRAVWEGDDPPSVAPGPAPFDCRDFSYESAFDRTPLSSRPPRIGQA